MIIDCHAHLAPRGAFEKARRQLGAQAPLLHASDGALATEAGGVHRGPLPLEIVDFGLAVTTLRKMGVEGALFSPPPFLLLYELPTEVCTAWSRILNDALAECLAGAAGMFGLATVPLQDPAAAVQELRRAVDDLGFRGVEIASNVAGTELDSPALDAFYQTVQELNVPILVHPQYVAGANRMQEYYLHNLVGNPLDTTLAAARLLLGGVFERFPGLRVCLSHAGGYLLAGLGRLDHGYHVRTEPRARASKPPSAYLGNLYFDTIGHSAAWSRFVVQQAGADHVLLGTDLPFDMGDADPVGSVKALGLDRAGYERIVGGNAAHIFALK